MADLLTTQQVADALGITAGRVRQIAIKHGIGTTYGRARLFTREELAMVAQRKTTPGPAAATDAILAMAEQIEAKQHEGWSDEQLARELATLNARIAATPRVSKVVTRMMLEANRDALQAETDARAAAEARIAEWRGERAAG